MRATRCAARVAIIVAGTVASALLWTVDGYVYAQQGNRVPEFGEGDSTIRVVKEGAAPDRNVGDPVEAVDPGDTLTYSLAGDDAGHFSIDSASGQLLTKSSLDYDTKSSYSVVVEVTDGADDADQVDPSIDDTIEVTIRVSVSIDLSDWTAEDYDSNTQYCASGSWTITGDGRAKETGGEAPSVLYGDFDAYGKRLTARVHPGSDDDYFGFVVGFDGGDSANADADYLLIDWKKQSQSFNFGGDSTSSGGSAEVGLGLSRVTGIPDCDEFWQHANLDGTGESSGLEELQEADSKGSTRYASQDYEFVIDFGSESIEVYLDGHLELDLDGEFNNGSFGAYAMLHNSATFWDFSYTDGSFPSISEPVDQPGEVTLSSTTSEVGVELTATLTDPDGGVLNKVWEWERSAAQDPPSWTPISGATSASYTPTATDAGKLLRTTVTYDDATGTDRTAVSAPTEAADQKGMVSLSTSQPVVGEALTATLSDADGSITNQVWAWESSPDVTTPTWSVIGGADSATYTPVALDAGLLLRVGVTYDDAVGMGRNAISGGTGAADQRGTVTIAPATPVVGEAVTAALTDADGGVTNEVWKWERSAGIGEAEWSVIDGATSSSYPPVASDDAGKRLRVMVEYTDGTGGGRSATSGATDRVDQRGVVTLSTRVPDVGIEVEATLLDADGGVTGEAWQWESSASVGTPTWSDITGATTSAYTLGSTDEGKLLRVTVGYEDAVGGGRSATSASTEKVGKPGVVSLDSSMPVVGTAVNATLIDDDGSVSSEVWQWESSPAQENPEWSDITDATSSNYTPVAGDAGRLLRVFVNYTDGSGIGRMAGSISTSRVDTRGAVTVMPEPPVVGKPVRAKLVDSDGSITNEMWEWERSPGTGEPEWTTINGARSSSYAPTETDDSGRLLRVVVVYDDGTGTDRNATSEATKRVDREGMVTVSPSPPVAGHLVMATLTDADGMVTNEMWQWERSPRTGTPEWDVISGAAASGYTPVALEDGGKILRTTASYDDAIGTGRVAVSASTLPVDRAGVVSLSTTMPFAGEQVVATLMDGDGGILNEEWQWESSADQDAPSWSVITGAEASTYMPPASLAGALFRVIVVYDDATGRGRQAMSDATAPLDQKGTLGLSTSQLVVGEALTATLTDADGGIMNQVWEWESSPDQDPLDWSVINGADSGTYTPVALDAGLLIRVGVTYDDAVGMGRNAISGATDAVDQRGAVTLSPVTPVVGEAVTAMLTDADGGVTNEVWKWERSPGTGETEWSVINGAVSSSYTPVALDDAGRILRVEVEYTDGTGSGRSATSGATDRVDQRGVVTLSTRVPDVGIEVEAALVDADGGVTGEAWQWESSASVGAEMWSAIADGTASTYTPTTANEGKLLRVTVGYEDAVGGGRSATSAGTRKVGKPGVVSVGSSMPVVGEVLTATLTDDDGSVSSKVWQWERSPAQENPEWSDVTDATSSNYTPVSGDAMRLLRVVVTYTDGSGLGRVASSGATAQVDTSGTVTVMPETPVVGKPVRAVLTDSDGSITNEMWGWERSPGTGEPEWTSISGARSSSYTPTETDDSGRLLRVVVMYDDGTGTGRMATSEATMRVDREGVVAVSPSPPVAGQPVTAMLTDADGMVTNEVWKWERSPRTGTPVWEEIAGATSATYTPTAADDGGKILRVSATYDDPIGMGRVAIGPSTLPVDRPGVITLTTSMPVVGEALVATLMDGDGGILNEEWQWEKSADQDAPSWSVITGAEASTYTPPASLAGAVLRATVVYDDTTGRGRKVMSDATAPLDQKGTLGLSTSQPVVGEGLTATLTDADGGIKNEVWEWESSPNEDPLDWSVIDGADSATYTPMALDVGRLLRVGVTYDDAVGMGRNAISGDTDAVDQRGAVTLSPAKPVVGEALTAMLTDADGGVTNEVWKWERSPGTGETEWSVINGAVSSSYTPVALDDAGRILRVEVEYTDGTGSGRSATSGATDRVDRRGVVTLSTSVPDVGIEVEATLIDTDGGVMGEVWQWESSASVGTPTWSDITGATASTYTPTMSDEGQLLRVTVGYEDAVGGGRSATSVSTEKVGKPGVVSVDSSVPVVGEELTATLTDDDGSVSSEVWQWESSPAQENLEWEDITDATSSSYTPVAGDAGLLLSVMVTYEDVSGPGRVASSAVTAQVDQRGTVAVQSRNPARDMPEVGVWQDAVLTDPDGMVSGQVWQWEMASHAPEDERTWNEIAGANSGSYKPVSSDTGKVLRVVATYSDGTGTGREATSAATERVDQPGMIELSSYSDVAVGKEVMATLIDPDGDALNMVWRWHRASKQDIPMWTKIDGAVSETYTPSEADAARILRVTVDYDDNIGDGRVAESPSTGAVDRLGVVTLSTQAPETGELLEAMLEDGDDGVRNVSWQWENSPAGGLPSWEAIPGAPELASYTPSSSVAGRLLRAVARYDDAVARRTAAGEATKPVSQPGVVTLESTEPVTGIVMTAVLADVDGGVTGEVWHWQWSPDQALRRWQGIPGANSETYVPVSGDAGMVLKVIVSYADSIAAGRTAESVETVPVDQPGVVSLSTLEPEVRQAVRAALDDADGGVQGEVWEWQRARVGNGDDWTPIAGASSDSYVPASGDAGYRLRAVVTYEDISEVRRTARSEPTAFVYRSGSVVLSPSIPIVGEPITARFSHPDSSPRGETWMWENSPGTGEVMWEVIPGAAEASYTPLVSDAGHVLRVEVTYEDGNGVRRSVTSEPSERVDQRGLVVLMSQMPVVGEVVTAVLTDLDGAMPGQMWRWERSPGKGVESWMIITGADGQSYVPSAPGDVGQLLRVAVKYDDGTGTGRSAISEHTERVDQRGVVSLSSSVPDVDVPLTAMVSDPDAPVTNLEWQWQRSSSMDSVAWADIIDADGVAYTPVTGDEGMILRVKAAYDDVIGRERHAVSPATDSVGRAGMVTFDSGAPVVGAAMTATLSDPDSEVGNVVWQWESSTSGPAQSWKVIARAGSAIYIPVSEDAGQMLRVLAVYEDATGVGRLAVSEAVGPVGRPELVVQPATPDANAAPTVARYNAPPVFTEGAEAERKIALGRAGAKAGETITATDQAGESLTYLLTGRDSAFFEADAFTGQVRIDRRLSFLEPGVYLVTLHAVDPLGGLASIKLTITVSQFSVPAFYEGDRAVRRVLENVSAGTLVGAPVRARDRDGDALTYSLVEADGALFEVDEGTAQIRTREKFDREVRSRYGVILRVEDGRGGHDSIQVDIEVADENEPPVFDGQSAVEFYVSENLPAGTAVGQPFVVEDPEQDPLGYSLSGDDADAFGVGMSTGQVYIELSLDYEARSSYSFKVGVEDEGGGSDEIDVNVEVVDVNEAPTFGSKAVAVFGVPENLHVGATVGEPFLAEDPEGDRLHYSLSGDGVGAFDMDGVTGVLVSKETLDFESRSSYLLRVSVVDVVGGSDSIYVTINVTDVEEPDMETVEEVLTDPATAIPIFPSSVVDLRPSLVSSEESPRLGADAGIGQSTEQDPLVIADTGSALSPNPIQDEQPEAVEVGDEPASMRTSDDTVEISHEAVGAGGTANTLSAVSRSPVVASSANLPVAVNKMPLWAMIALLILTYIDGILVVVISYRLWGRPPATGRPWSSTYNG